MKISADVASFVVFHTELDARVPEEWSQRVCFYISPALDDKVDELKELRSSVDCEFPC